jgi:hypothetical protein
VRLAAVRVDDNGTDRDLAEREDPYDESPTPGGQELSERQQALKERVERYVDWGLDDHPLIDLFGHEATVFLTRHGINAADDWRVEPETISPDFNARP